MQKKEIISYNKPALCFFNIWILTRPWLGQPSKNPSRNHSLIEKKMYNKVIIFAWTSPYDPQAEIPVPHRRYLLITSRRRIIKEIRIKMFTTYHDSVNLWNIPEQMQNHARYFLHPTIDRLRSCFVPQVVRSADSGTYLGYVVQFDGCGLHEPSGYCWLLSDFGVLSCSHFCCSFTWDFRCTECDIWIR